MLINETNRCGLCNPIKGKFQKDAIWDLVMREQVALPASTINTAPSRYVVHSQREVMWGAHFLICMIDLCVIESMRK